MLISISLNNSTVLVLVYGKNFELTRTRTRNSNSTWLETPQTHYACRLPSTRSGMLCWGWWSSTKGARRDCENRPVPSRWV